MEMNMFNYEKVNVNKQLSRQRDTQHSPEEQKMFGKSIADEYRQQKKVYAGGRTKEDILSQRKGNYSFSHLICRNDEIKQITPYTTKQRWIKRSC